MAESLRSIMGTKKSLTRRSQRAPRKRPEKKTSLTKRQLILRLNAAVDRQYALERLDEKRADELGLIRAGFEANGKLARQRARRSFGRRGDRARHSKFCAVARVWEMAAAKIPQDEIPF